MARYGTCEHSAQSAAEARLRAAAAQLRTAAEEVRGEVGTICRSGEEDVPMRRYTNTNLSALGTDSCLYRQAREQTVLLEKCKHDSAREQLVQVSMHYIRFLTEHPAFRRIVMQSFQDCDEEYRVLRGQMSIKTYEVVSRYCEEVQMPPDVRKRKTFIVRAIIYSAALFFDNGELEYNEKNMEQARGLLEREFDLP